MSVSQSVFCFTHIHVPSSGYKGIRSGYPGIYRYKTMTTKLMYIPNDDTQNYTFYRLQYVVETYEHLSEWCNQLKFNKSPQSCEANTL